MPYRVGRYLSSCACTCTNLRVVPSTLPVPLDLLNFFDRDWYECTGTFSQVPLFLANSLLEVFRVRCLDCIPGGYVLIVLVILGYGG